MNCRLNPTANGESWNGILHLGHVYMALINERIAHNSGAAKQAHISALVTSPLHTMSGHTRIEPWFYDAVRHSREVLCANTAR